MSPPPPPGSVTEQLDQILKRGSQAPTSGAIFSI